MAAAKLTEPDIGAALDLIEARYVAGQPLPDYFELNAVAWHKPPRIVRWCAGIDRRVARAKLRDQLRETAAPAPSQPAVRSAPLLKLKETRMRMPTPIEDQLAWHRGAVAVDGSVPIAAAVHADPQCGWFKRRMVKKGCWVPARIWLHQVVDHETGELSEPQQLLCEVDGERYEADDQWLWLCKEPITQAEFDYLTELRAWQRVNAPHEWDATVPVDHLSTPVLE